MTIIDHNEILMSTIEMATRSVLRISLGICSLQIHLRQRNGCLDISGMDQRCSHIQRISHRIHPNPTYNLGIMHNMIVTHELERTR